MRMTLPAGIQEVLGVLQQNGYEAYVVGGCVRDSCMGIEPHDWDVCTSATPEEAKRCFSGYHIVQTGIRYGTVSVVIGEELVEVTSFRKDGTYTDKRRPDEVTFIRDLRHDLARRDFTMNALAYNSTSGLYDYFGGIKDIEEKKIRCVGEPDTRFFEDALRIMRALRFSATLGFAIEEETARSIHENCEWLGNVSPERLRTEISRLIIGKNAGQVLKDYSDVIGVYIPEIKPMIAFEQNSPYHSYTVWEHTVEAVCRAPDDVLVRLCVLFHDIGKPACYSLDENGIGHFFGHAKRGAQMAREILERLRFDRRTIQMVTMAVLYHDVFIEPQRRQVKRWLHRLGEEGLRLVLKVKMADVSALAWAYRQERTQMIAQVFACMEEVIKEGECFCIRDLAVNGRDIMQEGVQPGPHVGRMLSELVQRVIDEGLLNEKETLMATVREWIQNTQEMKTQEDGYEVCPLQQNDR